MGIEGIEELAPDPAEEHRVEVPDPTPEPDPTEPEPEPDTRNVGL